MIVERICNFEQSCRHFPSLQVSLTLHLIDYAISARISDQEQVGTSFHSKQDISANLVSHSDRDALKHTRNVRNDGRSLSNEDPQSPLLVKFPATTALLLSFAGCHDHPIFIHNLR